MWGRLKTALKGSPKWVQDMHVEIEGISLKPDRNKALNQFMKSWIKGIAMQDIHTCPSNQFADDLIDAARYMFRSFDKRVTHVSTRT